MPKLNVYEVFRGGELAHRFESCELCDTTLAELMELLEETTPELKVERTATWDEHTCKK